MGYLVNSPEFGWFNTSIHLKASNPLDADKKLRALYPEREIELVNTTRKSSWDEHVLDMLWTMDKELYLSLWEPEITTKQMIHKLRQYPEWEVFYAQPR